MLEGLRKGLAVWRALQIRSCYPPTRRSQELLANVVPTSHGGDCQTCAFLVLVPSANGFPAVRLIQKSLRNGVKLVGGRRNAEVEDDC